MKIKPRYIVQQFAKDLYIVDTWESSNEIFKGSAVRAGSCRDTYMPTVVDLEVKVLNKIGGRYRDYIKHRISQYITRLIVWLERHNFGAREW